MCLSWSDAQVLTICISDLAEEEQSSVRQISLLSLNFCGLSVVLRTQHVSERLFSFFRAKNKNVGLLRQNTVIKKGKKKYLKKKPASLC